MADILRIEELRRRVLADPASVAFAALAEEYRRGGSYDEAIETCRVGLQRHPAYLSARVTLGRALIEVGDYDGARTELRAVLDSAPENLAAIRAMADIHSRLGHAYETPIGQTGNPAGSANVSEASPATPRVVPFAPPPVEAPAPEAVTPLPEPIAPPARIALSVGSVPPVESLDGREFTTGSESTTPLQSVEEPAFANAPAAAAYSDSAAEPEFADVASMFSHSVAGPDVVGASALAVSGQAVGEPEFAGASGFPVFSHALGEPEFVGASLPAVLSSFVAIPSEPTLPEPDAAPWTVPQRQPLHCAGIERLEAFLAAITAARAIAR